MNRTDRSFSVHLFKVEAQQDAMLLGDLLEMINEDSLEQRARIVNRNEVRVEALRAPTKKEPYWLIDFCRLRYSGPGQASIKTPVEDISLKKGNTFAEETSALFLPETNWLLLQYNHFGTRSSSVRDYFSNYLEDNGFGYELQVKLREDAYAALAKAKRFYRLQVKVATSELQPEFLRQGMGIGAALDASARIGGEQVLLNVGSSLQKRRPKPIEVLAAIPWLKKLAESGAADKLVLTGGEDDESVEPIDLLAGKLKKSFSNIPATAGMRLQAEDRWQYLKRAHREWRHIVDRP